MRRALGLLLAIAAGCAPEAQPPPRTLVDRPALESTRRQASSKHVVRVVWDAANGLDAVQVEAKDRRAVQLAGEPLHMLDGAGSKAARFALADGKSFDMVKARLLVRRHEALELRLHAGDELLHVAEVALAADSMPQDLAIEIPLACDTARVDGLTLRVRGDGPVAFAKVELLAIPLEDRLPVAGRGPDLIAIGDDLRRGVGLSSQTPLKFRLEPTAGTEVGFSYGLPQSLRRQAAPPELCVVLSAAGLPERKHLFPFEGHHERTSWHWVRLPLGDYAGKQLDVRFELQSASGMVELCAISEPKVLKPGGEPATVLLVTSDTHRADRLGAVGGRARTPVLDSLAARGVLFERCFSTTNVTLPSHVAILSGRHPRDTGILDNQARLSDGARTIAECFRDAGWHTVAATSAGHLAHHWSGLGQGFDRVLQTTRPDRRAGETITFLNRTLEELDGRPLFVWLHLFDAHAPYAPPEGHAEEYYAGDPRASGPGARPLPMEKVPAHLPGTADAEWVVANYDGETSYLDGELARLLERPRFRSATIAFTADHGESFGEHGVWWDHAELYPQTTRVPLVLAWPGAPTGARIATPTSNLDVGRTLLDLAGLRDVRYPGRNLMSVESRPEPLHLISSGGTSASIVAWPWQLVLSLADHHADGQGHAPLKPRHLVELYDLDSDATASVDLASIERDRASVLREKLLAWLAAREPLPWRISNTRDPAMIATLRELGYAGDEAAPEPGSDATFFPADCGCAECLPWQDARR